MSGRDGGEPVLAGMTTPVPTRFSDDELAMASAIAITEAEPW